MAQEESSSQLLTDEELDISWIRSATDPTPEAFFNAFSLCEKMSAHRRYTRMVKNSDLNVGIKKILLRKFDDWKDNRGTEFWVNRRVQSSQIRTAGTLVEGSEPYAEHFIYKNASQIQAPKQRATAESMNASSSSSSRTK
ncbi:hypothetical protein BGZ76_007632, partial [Entomortierella beljakovae]